MALRVKSLALLLLLAGVLSLFTVSASWETVIVAFVMPQRADDGQVFKIIGSGEELGNWNLANVENMTRTPVDTWVSSTILTKGVTYEYRAVLVSSSAPNNGICSMRDGDRLLTVPEDYAKSNYVETVFWDAVCGYDCHENLPCSTMLNPIRRT